MAEKFGDNAFTATSLYGPGRQPAYSGALSFMRRKYTRDLAGVDVAVSGIPFDLATSNRPGTRFGPSGIRRASAQLAYGEIWPWGFDPFDRLAVIDYGDCEFDVGYVDRMLAGVEAHAATIIEAGVTMLTFGGDHFVSLPLLRAHAKAHGKLSLVHFDAHSDTWRDENFNHGTMFFHALEEGLIDPERSIHVGIRSHNPETHGFTVLDAPWVHDNGPAAVIAEIERVVGDSKAYLTFDIDFLDPSFAPGTGTPVVGGLSTHQAQRIMIGLGNIDFIAMDLVEVAPIYDVGEITSLAAATIATDFLCLRAAKMEPVRQPEQAD
jgi:agmatinase